MSDNILDMRPLLPVSLLLALLSAPLSAQVCNLGITVQCTPNGGSSHCVSVTTNNGSSSCSGFFYTGFEAPGAIGSLTGYQSGLSGAQCFDSSSFPQQGMTIPYAICFGQGSIAPGGSLVGSVSVSGAPSQAVLAFTGVADPNSNSGEPTFVYA